MVTLGRADILRFLFLVQRRWLDLTFPFLTNGTIIKLYVGNRHPLLKEYYSEK